MPFIDEVKQPLLDQAWSMLPTQSILLNATFTRPGLPSLAGFSKHIYKPLD